MLEIVLYFRAKFSFALVLTRRYDDALTEFMTGVRPNRHVEEEVKKSDKVSSVKTLLWSEGAIPKFISVCKFSL